MKRVQEKMCQGRNVSRCNSPPMEIERCFVTDIRFLKSLSISWNELGLRAEFTEAKHYPSVLNYGGEC